MRISDLALSHTVCRLDIKDSSRGNASRQRHLDKGLRAVVDDAIGAAPFDTTGWFHRTDGDSATIAFPADVPKAWVAAEFTRQLELALRRFNEPLGQTHTLRLRMALDHGDVTIDRPNIAGAPVRTTARLVESSDLRRALQLAPAVDLAWIVSERFFDDVVQERDLGLDPTDFVRVRVEVKQFRGRGWLRRARGPQLAEGAGEASSAGEAPSPASPDHDDDRVGVVVRGNAYNSPVARSINASQVAGQINNGN
jgi:class 3 adenylate cyclase